MNNGILNKRTSEIKYKTVFEKKKYIVTINFQI